ncbi:MAG: PKD domain-containing protein [Bacteroidia bacterium]|nr:PKD domain-containing protein [Bacteroidia bacterium]
MKDRIYLIFLFVFFFSVSLRAQVTASFSASQTTGCGNLPLVNFFNMSTGSGSLSYVWNFGNSNTSVLQNPSTSYPNPGDYLVVLTVTNGTQSDTAAAMIHVYNIPTAIFTSGNHDGCIPLTVNFQDGSTVTGSTIIQWQWYFGDGYESNDQNPVHMYQTAGSYPVSLQVTDAHGCVSTTYNLSDYVHATIVPVIQFTSDYTSYCLVPLTVNFTNTTVGSTALTYNWTFGDGGTSTLQNPSHTYVDSGFYDVSLTVIDQYGCSNDTTITDYMDLTIVTASFSVVEGDTVCQNQMVHFNNTSGVPGWWIYGNGTSGTLDSTIYPNTGNVTVTLIAAPGTPCADTISRNIVVIAPPIANFSLDDEYGCKVPHTVHFTNQSTGAVSWAWAFGDNNTSAVQNPTNIYNTQGTFIINLAIASYYGCRAAHSDTVYIEFPVADFLNDTNMGCKPLPVPFTNSSHCNTTFDNISSYIWTFGDGGTSILQNPTHTYTQPGNFWVRLTITTAHGCTAKDSLIVNVGSHQHPGFVLDNYIICAQDTIKFTNTSTDRDTIDYYNWSSSSPVIFGSDTIPLPPTIVRNTVDTGYMSIQLIVGYNGCKDTLIDSIYVNGPIIKTRSVVTSLMNCNNPYQYFMTTVTQGVQYWVWNWRDSSLVDTTIQDTIMHTFPVSEPSTPDRMVLIYAVNDTTGCIYKDSILVHPKDIHANFDSMAWHDTICYTPNLFTASSFKDAFFWNWNFGDNTPATGWGGNMVSHVYDTSGTFTVWLYAKSEVQNELQCVDSVSRQVRVFKPEVEFRADTLIGCAQSPITVPFHSQAFSNDIGLMAWLWTFGDGQVATDTFVTHSYPIANYYTVSLQVTDSLGCINSLTKNNFIASLSVTSDFNSPDTIYCTGEPVSLNSTSSFGTPTDAAYQPIHWLWYFGNGDSSLVQNPMMSYPVKGDYDVTLIVYDTLGCSDTLIITNYLQAQSINAQFRLVLNGVYVFSDSAVSVADTNCYPVQIGSHNLTNQTLTEYNPTYIWDFGNGGSSILETPSFSYVMPGTYYLTMQTTTSHGCIDKDTMIIQVGGPWAEIILSDSMICKSDTVAFNITDTISISSVSWNFGDGYASTNFAPQHQYSYYPDTGYFVVTLNAYSGSCQMYPAKTDTIHVIDVIARFNRGNQDADTSECQPYTIYFFNLSTGADLWSWNFGDGTTSNTQFPPPHLFVNANQSNMVYNVSLIIASSIAGCKDTVIKPVVIYPTPDITVSNDTLICIGGNASLHATGGSGILWSPVQGLSSATSYDPAAGPTLTTNYHALIASMYGCQNTDSVMVQVQQMPTWINLHDTTIVIGEVVNISFDVDQNNISYQWTPDYHLSCTTCPNPVAQPLHSTEYIIRFVDSSGCFVRTDTIRINVDANFSVAVPTVFTPNGDTHNDTIYVKGWGIKRIKKFSIYNRWGQLMFQTDDIHVGWDGTYNGQKQPPDTYTYFVEVELLDETTMSKKGNFSLLR